MLKAGDCGAHREHRESKKSFILSQRSGGITTEELLKELGVEFAADLAKISMEEAVKSYKDIRRCERRNGEGFYAFAHECSA